MRVMTSTEFMSKEEKEKIVKQFVKFAESGFTEESFTKAIYNHLHLHCGFIAHYNKDGFYQERFTGYENVCATVRGIMGSANHCARDYIDINGELQEILFSTWPSIESKYKVIELRELEIQQKGLNSRIENLKK